ncbi:MAG TPA: gamma-glutamyltransferase [Thermomicrobiaceae bacterium]|nr:gamma-glutamyltransferase [Thermomicrobiaceae bacterium]
MANTVDRVDTGRVSRMRRRTVKQEAVASRGMVTSNHPLASLAGTEMLVMGGNAIDAAVATMFALSVVEPMMTTIFGAGFLTIRLADGTVTTIDNYATVPLAAREDMFTPVPGSLDNDVADGLNDTGYLAVATGGTLLGWATAVERYGRLPLSVVVGPAARFARQGFRVSPYLNMLIGMAGPGLRRFADSAAVFLPGGRPAPVGSVIQRVAYADTLERVAAEGPDYLYRGPLGQAIAVDLARNGGLITTDDLAGYRVHERAPVRGTYRGYEIVSMAPASSGGTHIVQMLNILEGFDLGTMGFGSPESVHVIAEAMKIAFADRFRYMADPERVRVPVDWLTSKEYAAERRREIDPARAGRFAAAVAPEGEGFCTTHCCAVDADGNAVSTTQTLNGAFGSKVTVPGTGMLLNNCMHLMDPTPGRTNSIAPGKRILSSMSPTIVQRDGRPVLALGTPGGVRIFGSVMQAIINVIDHGMTLQEAVEAPRLWDRGPVLELEQGFDDLTGLKGAMEARGHVVETPLKVAGGMNGVLVDPETGLLHGAACWRADGAPMGFSGGDAIVENMQAAGIPI